MILMMLEIDITKLLILPLKILLIYSFMYDAVLLKVRLYWHHRNNKITDLLVLLTY